MPLFPVNDSDLADVAALVNSGYRGDVSRQGWTTEADFLLGERTNETALRLDLAARPVARLFMFREAPGAPLLGCVWLEPVDSTTWYLGMLTVRPELQNCGHGRTVLAEAEAIACSRGATRIRMMVVNIRDELIAWYLRRGYVLTGETKPFPYDSPFGKATRDDLSFIVLEKRL